MKITTVGTGYVGLVTGACLADAGNNVFSLDVDAAKIRTLNEGGLPMFEYFPIGRGLTDGRGSTAQSQFIAR